MSTTETTNTKVDVLATDDRAYVYIDGKLIGNDSNIDYLVGDVLAAVGIQAEVAMHSDQDFKPEYWVHGSGPLGDWADIEALREDAQ